MVGATISTLFLVWPESHCIFLLWCLGLSQACKIAVLPTPYVAFLFGVVLHNAHVTYLRYILILLNVCQEQPCLHTYIHIHTHTYIHTQKYIKWMALEPSYDQQVSFLYVTSLIYGFSCYNLWLFNNFATTHKGQRTSTCAQFKHKNIHPHGYPQSSL